MNQLVEIRMPDIGNYQDVPIIEMHVKLGDMVSQEQSLITVELDKTAMDIPISYSGVIKDIRVQIGDRISEGDIILLIEKIESKKTDQSLKVEQYFEQSSSDFDTTAEIVTQDLSNSSIKPEIKDKKIQASPSVRKFAREFDIDLLKVKGTGRKNRITQEDIKYYIRNIMQKSDQIYSNSNKENTSIIWNILPWPQIDFNVFGKTEIKSLSKIKKISGDNLARNWIMIPSVTYHEDADITDLENFRLKINQDNETSGIKVTILAFILKAVVKALQFYPELNSSLEGENLILKDYFNIGIAVNVPDGLVVPVIKDAHKKGIIDIAKEISELSKLARENKLQMKQTKGSTFTISSLGSIGGTNFSPIINAPEVAILGISKAKIKPMWNGKEFLPRLICPLSLTADHRVIDGALATYFNTYLAKLLKDFQYTTL